MAESSIFNKSFQSLIIGDQRFDLNQDMQLSVEADNVQKVKCKQHPKKDAQFIYLVPNPDNIRICNSCIKQDNILIEKYQDIKEILASSKDNDLSSYPVLTDPELNDKILAIVDSIDGEKEPIDEYFKELTQTIQVIIESRKKAQKLKIVEFGTLYQSCITKRADIMELDKLKSILLENDEVKLREFITNHVSNAEQNTQILKEMYNQFQTLKNEFSLDKPNKIKELICDLLKEINFFNASGSSPFNTIEKSEEYQNALKKQQKQLEDNCIQKNQSSITNPDTQQKLRELEKKNEELSKEITNLQKEISNQKSQISGLKQRNYSLNSDIYALRQSIHRGMDNNSNLLRQTDNQKKSTQSLNQHSEQQKELLPLKNNNLLPSTQLILSRCHDSKQLSVQKNSLNQLVFSNQQEKFYGGQAYLDFIIDPVVNYVIQIKIEQQQGQGKYFLFGLKADSKKDFGGSGEKLSYCEYHGAYGVNTLVKGKPILTGMDDTSLVHRSLEVRINIQKRMLRVGSLPNYYSVVQTDTLGAIDPATPYRFFLEGLNPSTKMTIKKLETVSMFDNSM